MQQWNPANKEEASLGDHSRIGEWEQDWPGAAKPVVSPFVAMFFVEIPAIAIPYRTFRLITCVPFLREITPPGGIGFDEEHSPVSIVVALAREKESDLPV